jgi:hypothetical protein
MDLTITHIALLALTMRESVDFSALANRRDDPQSVCHSGTTAAPPRKRIELCSRAKEGPAKAAGPNKMLKPATPTPIALKRRHENRSSRNARANPMSARGVQGRPSKSSRESREGQKVRTGCGESCPGE